MNRDVKSGMVISFILFVGLFFCTVVTILVVAETIPVISVITALFFVFIGGIFFTMLRAVKRASQGKSCMNRDNLFNLLDAIKVLSSLSGFFIEEHHKIIELFEKYAAGDKPHKIESLEKNKVALLSLGKRAEELQSEIHLNLNYESKLKSLMDTINKVDSSIWSSQTQIKQELNHYFSSVENIFTFNYKIIHNSARILYNLKTSIPLLHSLTKKSNEYTTAIMKEVLHSFELISGNTNQISAQTEITINSFMDINDQASLAYVSEKMKEIVAQFENFSGTITSLEDVSGNLLSDSLHSLFDIEETAKAIESLAEKIKLISINVRIEAARLGSDQKGFKVIGNEINDFADKTSKIAKVTYNRISETIESIDKIRDNYIASMDRVFDYVKNIEEKIQPFNHIISDSFQRIKLIITSLNEFSMEIDKQLKMTIGNFQHYDVVTQESDHIIRYLMDIQEYFNRQISSGSISIETQLPEADRQEIHSFIFEKFNVLAATENERAILEEFRRKYNIQSSVPSEPEGGHDIADTEDGVVLF